ncbi:MAG TPA: ester cyclase [Vicinamibacterales bacterium]
MTREELIAMFDRRRAAMADHDARALAADHAEESVLESPMAGTVRGRDVIEQVGRAFFAAFPDITSERDALIIDGDRVVEVETLRGTDTGGFMGMPPTQKAFAFPLVRLYTVRDGEIVHERRIYDFTGLLIQLGMLKAKPA